MALCPYSGAPELLDSGQSQARVIYLQQQSWQWWNSASSIPESDRCLSMWVWASHSVAFQDPGVSGSVARGCVAHCASLAFP